MQKIKTNHSVFPKKERMNKKDWKRNNNQKVPFNADSGSLTVHASNGWQINFMFWSWKRKWAKEKERKMFGLD